MKKFTGYSKIGVVAMVAIIAFVAVAAFLVIDGNNKATNFNDYNFYSIIEPTKDNGNIGDHVKGSKDAPVVIYEYADFQCEYCAMTNPRMNAIVEELDGKLAIVYRNYLLSYHKNGTAAASAAEAAGIQGYWKAYADELFNNQSEWKSASGSERTALFNKYFEKVTGGNGDLDKFNRDIASAEVSKKISFDMGISQRIGVSGTPSFYIDGQLLDFSSKDGGSVVINGQKIVWDKALTGNQVSELIKNIVKAKLGEE